MRTFRKQTHTDFRKRIKRVDPAFYRWGERGGPRDITQPRRFMSLVAGFICAYIVISVSNNRELLENSLKQGSLPETAHGVIVMALGGLLAISVVMLLVHVFRFLVLGKGGKRTNSGAVLAGVMGALMLVHTPASVWQTGFGMMDANSRSLMLTASATVEDVTGVDFGSAVFVSSQGR